MAPLVIGHRGFPARFADNSLAGVRAALAAGADGVEVDVRPCADGGWVCHHDRARGGVAIAEWRAADLERAGVATIEEVVDAVPAERELFVEVKPLSIDALARGEGALVEALRRRHGRLRLISSSTFILEMVGSFLPAAARSWIIDEIPPVLEPDLDLSPKHTLVERLLVTGRTLHPWTVNDAGRMRALAGLGVASITTNRPDLAVEVLHG